MKIDKVTKGGVIMAAIEFGIDGYGCKIAASNAISGRTYKCYYCKEDICVRKGKKRTAYFAHKPIHDRTPQQMVCEGYKGRYKEYGYIEDDRDKLYIFNGGIPVHLIEFTKGRYELVAMFPPLSNSSLSKLIEWDTKIRIIGDGREQIFSTGNLRRYKIKTANAWICVKAENFNDEIDEVKRKWLWGIKGVAFDDDLFRMGNSECVRAAQMSNIVVGKEYLFVHKYGILKDLPGLQFKKRGVLSFSQKIYSTEYDVYSVIVTSVTNESKAYIQKKGYHLIEKSDDLIPLWPPAAIEGKELIYPNSDNSAYLYHKKETNQQIFQWNNTSPSSINEKQDIIKCSSNNNILLISDYKFNTLAKEIRYLLTQERTNFSRNRIFNVQISCKTNEGMIDNINHLFDIKSYENVIIESNYNKIVAFNVNNMFVSKSSRKQIGDLLNNDNIWLSYMPFGCYKIIHPTQSLTQPKRYLTKRKITFEFIQKLYHCGSCHIPINTSLDKWITYAKNNNSNDLLRILLIWKSIGYMPDKAILLLNELEEN